MIFVTVGTHEQGMDRLFIELDKLIEKGDITDDVFAQIGYGNYKPKNFKYKEMISYDKMDELVKKSDIIITHGGPGSIFHPLQYGKVPIVVPRNPKFNEHVDDHQILFVKRLESNKKVLAVYDIENLLDYIINYKTKICNYNITKTNTRKFIEKFKVIIQRELYE